MSSSQITVHRLGEKNKYTSLHLLGQSFWLEDIDWSQVGTGVLTKTTGLWVRGVLTVNRSGGVITPGALCTWETSGEEGPGRAVGGEAGDDARLAGVADPFLSTIADDDFFFLITHGPIKVAYDGSATINVGSPLVSAANGRARVYVEGTDNADATFGVGMEAKTSGDADDLFRALVDVKW